jgi:hypothetical protein
MRKGSGERKISFSSTLLRCRSLLNFIFHFNFSILSLSLSFPHDSFSNFTCRSPLASPYFFLFSFSFSLFFLFFFAHGGGLDEDVPPVQIPVLKGQPLLCNGQAVAHLHQHLLRLPHRASRESRRNRKDKDKKKKKKKRGGGFFILGHVDFEQEVFFC